MKNLPVPSRQRLFSKPTQNLNANDLFFDIDD